MTRIGISRPELEALAVLNTHQVEYLLIGGFAVCFHGCRRRTKDVDLLTHNSEQNAARLYEAIVAILGYKPPFTANSLEQPFKQVRLGSFGPNIDILTSVKGLAFERAYAKRAIARESGVLIPVASKTHLLFIKRIEKKKAMKRLNKATADIECLENL